MHDLIIILCTVFLHMSYIVWAFTTLCLVVCEYVIWREKEVAKAGLSQSVLRETWLIPPMLDCALISRSLN